MRTVMTALVVGLMVTVLMAANTNQVNPGNVALEAAKALYLQQDFVGAQAACETVLNGYYSTPANMDIMFFWTQAFVGDCLLKQSKYSEAQAAYEAALRGYPLPVTYTAQIVRIKSLIGYSLGLQGKKAEAQAMYMECVTNYVFQLDAKDEASPVWAAFNQVNPQLMTTADYQAFVSNTLKATKATTNNAAFLGLLKSNLGKLQ